MFKFSIFLSLFVLALDLLFAVNNSFFIRNFKFIFAIVPLFIVFDVIERFEKKGIYFDSNGITWIYGKNSFFKNWKDVEIKKLIDLKFLKYLELNIEGNFGVFGSRTLRLPIFFSTSKSLIYLTEKYVPKDHELYRVIEDYVGKKP